MEAKIKIEDPDKSEVTIEIRMPLGDWKIVEKQLSQKWDWVPWPTSSLTNLIRDAVRRFSQEIIEKAPEHEPED